MKIELPVDNIVDIEEVSSCQWNRKRAKRRFVKWLKEHNNNLPALKDPVLLQLAQALRSESLGSRGTTSEWYSMDDILTKAEYSMFTNPQRD